MCEAPQIIARRSTQKLLDLTNGVLSDALEHVSKLRFRVDVVKLGGAKQRVNACGAHATCVGAGALLEVRDKRLALHQIADGLTSKLRGVSSSIKCRSLN
jgi:hypothetical protein